MYEKFISSTEASTQKNIDTMISNLELKKDKISETYVNIEKMKNSFNVLKISLVGVEEEFPTISKEDIESLSTLCQNFIDLLLQKKKGLSINIPCDKDIQPLQNVKSKLAKYNQASDTAIQKINIKLGKIKNDKQDYKRQLIEFFEGSLASSCEFVELTRLYNLFTANIRESE